MKDNNMYLFFSLSLILVPQILQVLTVLLLRRQIKLLTKARFNFTWKGVGKKKINHVNFFYLFHTFSTKVQFVLKKKTPLVLFYGYEKCCMHCEVFVPIMLIYWQICILVLYMAKKIFLKILYICAYLLYIYRGQQETINFIVIFSHIHSILIQCILYIYIWYTKYVKLTLCKICIMLFIMPKHFSSK